MANSAHVGRLLESVPSWNEWRGRARGEVPDLDHADLAGRNLAHADLMYAHLRRADLRGAVLTGGNLGLADCSEADLRGAVLATAFLCGAKFVRADLSGADLRWAIMGGGAGEQHYADFSHALLIGTRFTTREEQRAPAVIRGEPAGLFTGLAGNFSDLGCTKGLDTAEFGDPSFLPAYFADSLDLVFDEIFQQERKQGLPTHIQRGIENGQAIRTLFPDSLKVAPRLVQAVDAINAELIVYLRAHPNALYELRPRLFEELIAEILASFGWQVDLTPTTRDGGYDIFAVSPVPGTESTSWIIECKRYDPRRAVGVAIVRALYGLRTEMHVANAMVATTSHFSIDARKYKASRYDLKLRDYDALLGWINEYRPNPAGRLYLRDNRLAIQGAGVRRE